MKKAVSPYLTYDDLSVPIIKNDTLEQIADKILRTAEPNYNYRSPNVPILSILHQLHEAGFVQLMVEDLGYCGDLKIRGKTALKQNIIFLDIQLATSNEFASLFRMTAAHQLGHWVLHRQIPKVILDITDTDKELEGNLDAADERLLWLERQAKSFAAAMLLPKHEFTMMAQGLMKTMGCHRPDGKLYLYYKNQGTFYKFKAQLSEWFMVSETAIEIRLKKLNLLEDKLKVQTAGAILRDAINSNLR